MNEEITIEKMTFGGAGFARQQNGKAIFIEGAYPGEIVTVTINKDKKDYSLATCKTIIKASPSRVEPFCAYFGQCGGCSWQNLEYSAQTKEKKAILNDAWAKVKMELVNFELFYGHDREFRNRFQLHHNKNEVGMMLKNSNQILPIIDCPIAVKPIRDFISHFKSSTLPTRFHVFSNNRDCFIEGKNSQAHINIAGKDFYFSPNLFFQSNASILPDLISFVMEGEKGKLAYDLYSGVGLFSSFLTDSFETVLACEENVLVEPFFQMNVPKASLSIVSAERFLSNRRITPNLIIIDPPRTGISSSVIDSLLKLKVKRLIYISCDAITQLRDLQKLMDLYQVESVKAFDLFPQTHHMETVVKLSLK